MAHVSCERKACVWCLWGVEGSQGVEGGGAEGGRGGWCDHRPDHRAQGPSLARYFVPHASLFTGVAGRTNRCEDKSETNRARAPHRALVVVVVWRRVVHGASRGVSQGVTRRADLESWRRRNGAFVGGGGHRGGLSRGIEPNTHRARPFGLGWERARGERGAHLRWRREERLGLGILAARARAATRGRHERRKAHARGVPGAALAAASTASLLA